MSRVQCWNPVNIKFLQTLAALLEAKFFSHTRSFSKISSVRSSPLTVETQRNLFSSDRPQNFIDNTELVNCDRHDPGILHLRSGSQKWAREPKFIVLLVLLFFYGNKIILYSERPNPNIPYQILFFKAVFHCSLFRFHTRQTTTYTIRKTFNRFERKHLHLNPVMPQLTEEV